MGNKIFVIYIGVGSIDLIDIDEYVRGIINRISPSTFRGEFIAIPVFNEINTRIECINPKYITDVNLINEHTNMMKNLHQELNNIENELKENIIYVNEKDIE